MTQYAEQTVSRLRRVGVVAYGAVAYVVSMAALVYAIGFLANVAVPKGIDDGAGGPAALAVLVDVALLSLFAIQHSIMARPWFKRWWTRFVPVALERSTFVLTSGLVLALLQWQWRPLPESIWSVEVGWAAALLWTLYGLGWALLVGSTFVIDHFDLFGLRQVVLRARSHRYESPRLRQPLLYRLVRHPIMVGFFILFWATPQMTAGRLLFAAVASGYILVAVRFEERDLRASHGEAYERYAALVPRFIPRLARAPRS